MSWTVKPLAAVADLQLGKMLDERKNRGELLPYLANVNVRWGEFDFDELREMRFEQNELERFGLKAGDIVMCEGGEPGRCALWKDQVPGMMIQKALHRIRVGECSDSRFLYYTFLQLGRSGGFSPLFTGATIKHLPREKLAKLGVALPPLRDQQHIASILSAYDDLIENNRRRMVLLEDAARLLYQEWFVRLRFPGREHTRIVDGVPEGWRRRDLGALATFLSGGTPSKARADFWEGEIPWVSSGELTALRIDDASLHVTEEAVEAGSRLVPPRTILGVVRGMSLAKEFRLAMTSRTVCFNQDLKAIVAGPDIDADYLFHALVAQRDTIRDRAGEASHGTKKLDTPVLASTPILVPRPPVQRAFTEIVDPMNRLWDNLNRQNRQLRAARDLLLPRLMRGELLP